MNQTVFTTSSYGQVKRVVQAHNGYNKWFLVQWYDNALATIADEYGHVEPLPAWLEVA